MAENKNSLVEFSFNSGFYVIFRKLELIQDMGLGEKLEDKLGENELAIVKEMSKDPKITISGLSKIVGIITTSIENNITKLKEKGILKRIGPGKGGYWEVAQENRELNS